MNRADLFPEKVPPEVAVFLSHIDEVRRVEMPHPIGTSITRGKLILVVGQKYINASTTERVEFLRHECAHLALGHLWRMQDRDPLLWNIAADACVHHSKCADPGSRGVTFDLLRMHPCPAEIAYDQLVNRAVHVEGCGTFILGGGTDDSDESRARALLIGIEIGSALGARALAGDSIGTGRDTPEIAPCPPFIRQVLTYLTRKRGGTGRRRSWQREHRYLEELPGRVRHDDIAALILVDASGSMLSIYLEMFLGALAGTPELHTAQVAVFDATCSALIPCANIKRVQEEMAARGGGTLFNCAAPLRLPHIPTVWLTDGYPCDEWPAPVGLEVWVITTDEQPPHGIRVQA